MILNQEFDFSRDAPKHVKDAFKLPPNKVLLKTGQKLWRILTPVQVSEMKNPAGRQNLADDPNEVGQWWMTQKTFHHLVEMSKQQGKDLSEVVRAKLAISREFSYKMNALFIIQLKRDMYAFEGLAAPQPLSTRDRSVMLIGNTEQVWIPRMSWNDVFVVRFLNSFRAIDLPDLNPHLIATLGDFLRPPKGV
jgi:hypothetical protein